MHELKIAEELAAMVAGYAAEAGMKSVDRVNISFGQFIQIVPEIFEAAFREAAKDSAAAGAELDIEIIPAELRCLGCGSEYAPADDLRGCSVCGSDQIVVKHGKELFIKSIEGG
ncbi:hydrogenase maturation nickel metallochaperone HypA [bacterium]|jgi:hydrogenase nickel incorporation protein HypA/HybF|nr:hydrogenase maturation nickel metallochaperone HypA [bacterium]